MSTARLTDTMRRHLRELIAAPFWNPAGPGEWRTAWALERRGYLKYNPSSYGQKFELTEAGRKAAMEGK